MKLYYAPGACSLAPHILLNEIKEKSEFIKVNLREKKVGDQDYLKINSKGSVPVLILPTGQPLTECAVIMQYLSDLKPDAAWMATNGTSERWKQMEWLNFIATDLHKTYTPLFSAKKFVPSNDAGREELKSTCRSILAKHYDNLDQHLEKNPYLCGKNISSPDLYLFVVNGWSKFVDIDLKKWKHIQRHADQIAARPAVVQAMKEEGLL